MKMIIPLLLLFLGLVIFFIVEITKKNNIIDNTFIELGILKIEPSKKSTPKEYTNLFEDKIWLHRVNSSERLHYYYDSYSGFEIDIRYNQYLDIFNVDHDNDSGNQSLDELFNAITASNKYFWLDFKNLDHSNVDDALQNINEITSRFNLDKNKIIIESSNIECLTNFTDNGFLTSYYFTLSHNEDIGTQISQIIQKLDNNNVIYISSDARYLYYLDTYFPNMAKLYWYLKRTKSHKKLINKILIKNYNAQVILNADIEYFYR